MTNLFSVFDPLSSLPILSNWVSACTMLLLLPPMFWSSPSQGLHLLKVLTTSLYTEFKSVSPLSMGPGSLLLPLSICSFIAMSNSMGLVPYIFTPTSHLTFGASLALPLWAGHISMAWVNTTKLVLAHLVPLGTPLGLMPLMVMIELTSNIIRPLTLTVRLTANMTAGHLLLTLLSNQGSPLLPASLLLILSILTALILLESAVALIQSYVFSLLPVLYLSEVSSPQIS